MSFAATKKNCQKPLFGGTIRKGAMLARVPGVADGQTCQPRFARDQAGFVKGQAHGRSSNTAPTINFRYARLRDPENRSAEWIQIARRILVDVLEDPHDAMAFHALQIGIDQMFGNFLSDGRAHPNLPKNGTDK